MLSFHARKRQLTQFLESSAASKEPAIGPWTERCHGTFSDRIHCRHVVPPSSTNKLWAGRLWGHLFSQLFTKFVEFLRVSPCPLQDSQSEQSRLEASTYTKCVKTPLTLSTLLEDALLDALLQLHVPFPKFGQTPSLYMRRSCERSASMCTGCLIGFSRKYSLIQKYSIPGMYCSVLRPILHLVIRSKFACQLVRTSAVENESPRWAPWLDCTQSCAEMRIFSLERIRHMSRVCRSLRV